MRTRAGIRIFLVLALCWAQTAQAQTMRQGQAYQVMSGTGFIVSSSGHIITNHHVIAGCKEVELQGAIPRTTAKVVAFDEQYDLALLKTKSRVRRIATIRHPDATRIRMHEPLLVMGYPLDSYIKGEYKVAESRVIGLKGPTDEPHWIQFADSVQQGNSGGPLLDASGNVAGVVVGKTELYEQYGRNGRRQLVSKSDVAIALPVLMRFLDKHYVAYRFRGSHSSLMAARVEDAAKSYIVNVLCKLPA